MGSKMSEAFQGDDLDKVMVLNIRGLLFFGVLKVLVAMYYIS